MYSGPFYPLFQYLRQLVDSCGLHNLQKKNEWSAIEDLLIFATFSKTSENHLLHPRLKVPYTLLGTLPIHFLVLSLYTSWYSPYTLLGTLPIHCLVLSLYTSWYSPYTLLGTLPIHCLVLSLYTAWYSMT